MLERFAAANSAELTRADTKAAVLLGFTGAILGVFVTITGGADGRQAPSHWWPDLLWCTAVVSALSAVVCFVLAIAPRRRERRPRTEAAPEYFEHIGPDLDCERLNPVFQRVGRDPAGPLLSSLIRTSAIVRAKYRWIEVGSVLLLTALPQFTLVLRPT
ncbi:hypothetical protein JGS22_007100 [Streptomyces sp. P38-E01]|uniref:Pycsar effector protein domain-containing protein n=1 Tax=Streptomyces tardus TaxID=2780544 RepID=A0A949JF79_9ACTN|nr:Pycsar system effector family protein [Streptomyces tardus]MBU7597404.1 hypothetical protein [Streptomyces tardus]